MEHDIARTILRQIGGDILAISGGRYRRVGDTVVLPVASGYSVEVTYCRGLDAYRVERIYTRGSKRWVKTSVEDVYADMLAEVAYRASCYND